MTRCKLEYSITMDACEPFVYHKDSTRVFCERSLATLLVIVLKMKITGCRMPVSSRLSLPPRERLLAGYSQPCWKIDPFAQVMSQILYLNLFLNSLCTSVISVERYHLFLVILQSLLRFDISNECGVIRLGSR